MYPLSRESRQNNQYLLMTVVGYFLEAIAELLSAYGRYVWQKLVSNQKVSILSFKSSNFGL